jgi:phosphoglycerate dehydrogenase-like enzyme
VPSRERRRGTVLVTWMRYDADGAATGRRLTEAGLEVALAPKTGARSPRELAALAAAADAAIVSTDPFDATVFAAAPRLRVIAHVGVGTDSIDLDAATAAGVAVTITPGANHETVADHALALVLAAVRRVLEHDASVRRGEWNRAGALTPWDVHGATVGLVGYGAIGRAVGRRLAGFGVRLLVADPAADPEPGIELAGLDELLARSDVVSLHLPLARGTEHLIGADQLARMQPHAILVNTSRGGVVDEGALVAALRGGRLRAAALDVFASEPHVAAELRTLPNVVLTPHVGGLSERSIASMTAEATDCVLAGLAGRLDRTRVANPAVLGRVPRARRMLAP